MTGEWNVRAASANDLRALRRIAGACAEAPRWGEGVWRGLLAGDGEFARSASVADAGGEIVGFVVVSCAAGVAEIESVVVLPAWRRLGVGRALCLEAMRWARGRGAGLMELEVRAASVGAIGLYGCLGFLEQGRRRAYYSDPVDDAVLMAVALAEPGHEPSMTEV